MDQNDRNGADPKACHIISSSASLREVLSRINVLSGEAMTLFATAADGDVAGTITDGDIRRALLAGRSLDDPASAAMHEDFIALRPGCDRFSTVREARRKGIRLLPDLDECGRIVDIMDLKRLKNDLPIDAVLMAGGRGERLRPLTLDTPKPLLRVGGKAIIDYNVDELEANGVDNIFVTVNYLAGQIEEHFAARGGRAEVRCVREPKRLGTIGSLALVNGLSQPDLLLMNSDLLTSLSFEEMYEHHRRSGADLTMAVTPYTVSVPFAVVRTESDRVTGLEEKPSYNYFANAGVYMMRRGLVGRLVAGELKDAPDFVEELIADGLKVSYFPVNGTWIDIGSPEDFRLACKMMENTGITR